MTIMVCAETAELLAAGDPVGFADQMQGLGCKSWVPLSQAITSLDTAASPDVLGITDAGLLQVFGAGAASVIGLWILGLGMGWAIKAIQALTKED